MRPIGFSTGALAYADFRRGLAMTRAAACAVVELSALRQAELFPLLDSLKSLDLAGFQYISIHAPSQFEPAWEAVAWDRLREECGRTSILAYQEVAHLIPPHVPLILETPVAEDQMEAEVAKVRKAVPLPSHSQVA
jgi:hypothetical protein